MLDGTASAHLVKLVRDTALTSGVPGELVARIPGTEYPVDDRVRLPLAGLGRLWTLLAHTLPEGTAGLRVADSAPLGTMPAWDYLLVNGATLADALVRSTPYHRVVTASEERYEVRDLGSSVEVGYRTSVEDSRASAAVHEYVLAYYLRRAREATRREVVPSLVRFSHPAPPSTGPLRRAFGTDRLEFGAGANTVAFRAEDARAPLPGGDPRVADLLRDHAGMLLENARPVPGWHDLFRSALEAELDLGAPALDSVAARLATSPRTLRH
ncbi:AraC family transcriptional regulator ligand-binding domain-containing protein [Nocardiopsis deserti]|uniref:AraC family transcriptional regulator ligand-binding domain-containing protein n=1 Tax=Nocardiopsis deserti TaxID=2605988 RepID=UPI001CC231E6|nr:AraC family transcriptional regulator ligand-binding domain-containing protein [Nocardiopsis deserti]